MAELENTNPIMDNAGNPVNPEPEVNAATSEPEQDPDYSQLFSENIAESTQTQNEPAPTVDDATPSEPVNQPVETPVQEQAVNIEQEIAHTSLDNHQPVQPSQEAIEAEKARVEQQKLAWLKEHEKKAKKSWLASWIFYGILLTLLLLIAGIVFAKDYVLNAIDYIDSLIPTSSISSLNKNNNPVIENIEVSDVDLSNIEEEVEEDTEEVDPIQQYYDRVDEIVSSEDDQETKAELLNNILTEVMQESEEPDEELTQYISQAIMDLTINSEEEQIEENIEDQESSEEEIDNPELNNEVSEENIEELSEDTETIEDDKWYTITRVNSEEDANRVMPSHCTDLTCYGEDEEFVACTSFRMIETLDENTPRVSSRWGCKYKDASELVYVEFSNAHNSAEEVIVDSPTDTETEAILEVEEPTAE